MTDAFPKFSVAVITPNQQVKMVAKALVVSGFTLMEYQQGYIVTRAKVSITKS